MAGYKKCAGTGVGGKREVQLWKKSIDIYWYIYIDIISKVFGWTRCFSPTPFLMAGYKKCGGAGVGGKREAQLWKKPIPWLTSHTHTPIKKPPTPTHQ